MSPNGTGESQSTTCTGPGGGGGYNIIIINLSCKEMMSISNKCSLQACEYNTRSADCKVTAG